MADNPLVATPVDTATATSGAGLLDDGVQLSQAIASGDWVAGGLAAFSTGVDTAAAVSDPIGSLIAAGLGWLMDHLEPLKGWVDDLTGNAGEVRAFAQTWANIAQALQEAGTELDRLVGDVQELEGETIEAYRRYEQDAAQKIGTAGTLAGAFSTGLGVASTIVQVVHDVVRDTLAQLVGSIISWVAEAVFTAGLATPVIIEQVATRVSSLATRLGKQITELLSSFKELKNLLESAKNLLSKAKDLFDAALKNKSLKNLPWHDIPSRAQKALTTEELDALRAGGHSQAWFDDVAKHDYYDGASPTLGGAGRPFFVMPTEDGAIIKDAQDAARYTGMSPATVRAAYETPGGGDIYTAIFPKGDIPHSVPTAADARGWEHFLEGGHTAVKLPDGGGYLVNPTREFVIPGGTAMPSGGMIARLGENGELIPVRRF